MKECDNSKIHISSKFILPINLLIMFDTLLLRPSLHCNTSLHFTTLHPTTLHYTSLHFTTLHPTTLHYTYRHFTQLHFTSSHAHFTCCSEITIRVTYCECVSVSLGIQHEERMHHIIFSPAQTAEFREKVNIKCVFRISLQICTQHFSF